MFSHCESHKRPMAGLMLTMLSAIGVALVPHASIAANADASAAAQSGATKATPDAKADAKPAEKVAGDAKTPSTSVTPEHAKLADAKPADKSAAADKGASSSAGTKALEKFSGTKEVTQASGATTAAKPVEKATADTAKPSTMELAKDGKPLEKSTVATKTKVASSKGATAAKPMSAWRRAYIAKHGHQPPVKAP